MLRNILALITLSAMGSGAGMAADSFGPSNPFYAPSTLPFQAPPFDKIKDEDYQPVVEAADRFWQLSVAQVRENNPTQLFEVLRSGSYRWGSERVWRKQYLAVPTKSSPNSEVVNIDTQKPAG